MSQKMPLANGKKTRGQQRRENRRVEKKSSRQVTFSKRKAGIWGKAAELSVLCGANIAIVVFSEAGRVYAFGSPSVDAVLGYIDGSVPAAAPAAADEGLEALFREKEKKAMEVKAGAARLSAIGEKVVEVQKQAGKQFWWEADVDALGEEELLVFARALEHIRDIVLRRAEKLRSAPPPQ